VNAARGQRRRRSCGSDSLLSAHAKQEATEAAVGGAADVEDALVRPTGTGATGVCLGTTCSSFVVPLSPRCTWIAKHVAWLVRGLATIAIVVRMEWVLSMLFLKSSSDFVSCFLLQETKAVKNTRGDAKSLDIRMQRLLGVSKQSRDYATLFRCDVLQVQ
jgi:hypothetical protein